MNNYTPYVKIYQNDFDAGGTTYENAMDAGGLTVDWKP
jgi:hypothetical protein